MTDAAVVQKAVCAILLLSVLKINNIQKKRRILQAGNNVVFIAVNMRLFGSGCMDILSTVLSRPRGGWPEGGRQVNCVCSGKAHALEYPDSFLLPSGLGYKRFLCRQSRNHSFRYNQWRYVFQLKQYYRQIFRKYYYSPNQSIVDPNLCLSSADIAYIRRNYRSHHGIDPCSQRCTWGMWHRLADSLTNLTKRRLQQA